ncbi:putative superfamily II helicase/VV D11-like transcription factor [Cafeteria roenbergensis virus]|uniref:Putative superfamily II helicase/VV D11-like transcription factor n=1 Tax=Cafeteria roenbergensis virus (strain BV-PW1) TaxID=693272 RepID=E3T4Q1_CROVB|nr:putative superfamily II helicase/VV D11-like transcription factor [Cafeteria roenbergensis virus BV-PW1]ADO67164.1 putative superfamily II helicase/VV D11-like transcription factor [Cafeteria roenbergensis virus BV-PW1]
MKYPDIEDENFNNLITKKLQPYYIKKTKKTMKQLCQPKKFKLQNSQKLVADFMGPSTPYNNLLVFHQIGSGKTCTAITVAEQWKHTKKILILTPASLVDNMRDELRSSCGQNNYITLTELKELEKYKVSDKRYQAIIKKSNERIAKFYNIMSYHKFVKLALDNKINLKNTLLIIDEIQNMVSESGTFYRVLYQKIINAPSDLKILLLSATPMFDRPQEIGLTLNLLRPTVPFPIGTEFVDTYLKKYKTKNGFNYRPINMRDFKDKITGLISYYRGANPISYPDTNFMIKRITMNEFQYKSYLGSLSDNDGYIRGAFKSADILNLPTNFLIGPRVVSNIAFPNKCTGSDGIKCLRGECLELQNLKNYSIKFYHILKKLKQSEGPCFVYSNFKTYGGIDCFIRVLKKHGWKDFKKQGEGTRRFAIWSGDETMEYKSLVKSTFNQPNNHNGSKLHLILGSPSIKEGVTLKRLEQMHILEPYWNLSRMLQIIGRGVRYCSHADLPKRKRKVDIYLYLAKTPDNRESVDEYIWKLAKQKAKLINQFEKTMKEHAIDCEIFYNANYDSENPLKCFS